MHTENAIVINAPLHVVFQLAANVEEWPHILPHYRYVRRRETFLSRGGVSGAVFSMCATRSGYPARWTSVQEPDPSTNRILYFHIHGVTAGMTVVWTLQDLEGDTIATIDHDLDPSGWLRNPLASHIVGTEFVMNIADRTLQGIKTRAESTLCP